NEIGKIRNRKPITTGIEDGRVGKGNANHFTTY
ncbi:unnamed protein product, partial [marine sediment metagenome]